MNRTAYVSEKADEDLIEYLRAEGCRVELVGRDRTVGYRGPQPKAAEPVACHPDIYMCRLAGEIYIGDPARLSAAYPGDVLYNAAQAGGFFLCSKYTDAALRAAAESRGLLPVLLPQGYVKCNVAVLGDDAVITSDAGIKKVLDAETNIKSLLIRAGHIALPGYKYGFIGGATGLLGRTLIFNGELAAHPDGAAITDFVRGRGLEIKDFPGRPLTDIGSIIIL